MKFKSCFIWGVATTGLMACASTSEPEIYRPPEKQEIIRPKKDRAQSLTDLGLAYYQLGKYTYAQEYLDRSLDLDSKNPVTYQVMALIKMRSHQADAAQEYFDQALDLAPENYDIVTDYAVFLYEQQRYAEALAEFTRVINAPFYKKKWVAYTYLGLYDLKNKQVKAAEIKFYTALKMNASYAPALMEMAKIRYAKADMMSARAFIERYFAAAGKSLESLKLAIKVERALQDVNAAEQYQLELKRAFPFSE